MSIGQSAFSQEELDADLAREEAQRKEYEQKLTQGFFKDGGVRKVVITNISKEDKVSQKGNNYVLHTYMLQDVESSQTEEVIDRNFAVTNALGPVKKELGVNLRLGTTVLKIVTTKTGEQTWNGLNYPIWKHAFEVESNPGVDANKAF